jgi:hypothetical protein
MKTQQDDHEGGLRKRLINAIVQPVPDDLALCEFECSKTECSAEEWKHCRRRREAASVGALVTARNGP